MSLDNDIHKKKQSLMCNFLCCTAVTMLVYITCVKKSGQIQTHSKQLRLSYIGYVLLGFIF